MGMMRVAVTGGSGRVGRHVVKAFVDRGHEVVNLDRMQPRDPAARFVYTDLTKRELVHPILEGMDAVCHLGEIPGPWAGPPDHVYKHNTAAASSVLQSAADLKIKRVIYTSSCQVYGCYGDPIIAPKHLPFDETHPLVPQNGYSLSKLANEAYARYTAEQFGISVAIFRFPSVWAWTADGLSEMHWAWLRDSNGSAEELGTYVHSEDAARAYVLAVENPRPGCEVYQFSAKEIMSPAPLAARMEVHNKDYPKLPEDWPPFKSPLLAGKAKEHFGWEPEYNLLDVYREKFGGDPAEPVAPEGSGRGRRRRLF